MYLWLDIMNILENINENFNKIFVEWKLIKTHKKKK